MPTSSKESEPQEQTLKLELRLPAAQLVYTLLEQVPINGPEGKRIAAEVQQALIGAMDVVD